MNGILYRTDIKDNFRQMIEAINISLDVDGSFDLIYKTFDIADKRAAIYFIDGLVKDDIMEKLLEFFAGITEEDFPVSPYDFLKKKLPYVEVDKSIEIEKFKVSVLSGVVGLIIEGYEEAILIDCRTYPARGVEEPDKDKVLRGSRDGFTETMVMNVALIRRRIRSDKFNVEILDVGSKSHTDVSICYMNDKADKKLIDIIKNKIKESDVSALTMNQESLAEILFKSNYFNPFPKFRYSERPDTAAASILEGSIVILVDNSPAAMILPVSLFDLAEEANDYYFPPITGTYLRLARIIITIISFILTPLFLLAMQYPEKIPNALEFIKVQETVNVPYIVQFLILELAVDGMKLAAVNTPNMLSTPLSVIAGFIIGDTAVKSGWFNAEVMLYMAFVAFANFTHGSFELGYSIKFFRIITLLLTAIGGIYGFVAGILFFIICLATNKTIAGRKYLYPLIPLNGQELLKRLRIRRK